LQRKKPDTQLFSMTI